MNNLVWKYDNGAVGVDKSKPVDAVYIRISGKEKLFGWGYTLILADARAKREEA